MWQRVAICGLHVEMCGMYMCICAVYILGTITYVIDMYNSWDFFLRDVPLSADPRFPLPYSLIPAPVPGLLNGLHPLIAVWLFLRPQLQWLLSIVAEDHQEVVLQEWKQRQRKRERDMPQCSEWLLAHAAPPHTKFRNQPWQPTHM